VSRLIFHSPSGDAQLNGSERSWFSRIVWGVASAAWGIDDAADRFMQLSRIIAMIPPSGGDTLGGYLRVELAKQRQSGGPRNLVRLVSSLNTYLDGVGLGGCVLRVGGHDFSARDVARNTALVAGSAPVQLAAKLDGYGEMHCWVDGPDRAWLADVMEQGLEAGIFRRGFWFVERPCHGDPAAQPDRKWSDQGWGEVTRLLRDRDDEPVVCSYTVCDQFPNREAAEAGGWQPAPLPDNWVPDWAVTDGRNEWDAMPADQQDEYRRKALLDQWAALPESEQWGTGMAGLRTKPWLQLTPASLGGQMFGHAITVYDLLAPDRDERVAATFRQEDAQ